MGHGGARENSGRKPKFLTDNETTHIRVPKALKTEIVKWVEDFDRKKASGELDEVD